jgi:hypothetical protein
MWTLPMAALNQLVIYDELASGRKPRWADSGERGALDIEAMLAEALTGGVV